MPPLSGIAALHHHLSAGSAVMGVEWLRAGGLPAPVRRLLDQDTGMTGTLERHWRTPLAATVLNGTVTGGVLRRCVVLSAGPVPVEVAGIDVMLAAVPPGLRPHLPVTDVPLGRLFRDNGIGFRAVAETFFTVACDGDLAAQAAVEPGTRLFGRVARLDADGTVLARTVEVLVRV
ncbi:chorismate-pyruvate lyase [Azospirillum fermentarium]|uniref:hypothetical protein n=1 Tax=Azospirillum fermentarium TaxID=1233114 RepID=UPI002226B72E|nr:hypothetical protein [Azospirillum fermentarium]MCW2246674.1 chorismate-pyruvate lyase [Azospirillum fermentarium]